MLTSLHKIIFADLYISSLRFDHSGFPSYYFNYFLPLKVLTMDILDCLAVLEVCLTESQFNNRTDDTGLKQNVEQTQNDKCTFFFFTVLLFIPVGVVIYTVRLNIKKTTTKTVKMLNTY